MRLPRVLIGTLLALAAAPAAAQTYAERLADADLLVRDFVFASGERLPELRLHYATLGTPRRNARGEVTNAVMVLHGTGGSGRQFLAPQFADALYGPGQPLDLARYFVILPDAIGHGKSSKPSDGLRMRFPTYDYDDMVAAHRRVLGRLGVKKLRLMIGTSMGCMHGFAWAAKQPDFARAMLPMACLPVAIVGHNRMWRKAAIEGIKADPAWAGGGYAAQPAQGLRTAASLLTVVGFAPRYLQKAYATRDAADAYVVERITADIASRDANDLIYQLEASRNYDPSAALARIATPMTWINSSDDYINPFDYGIAEAAAKRLPDARFVLVRATDDTRGHGTHTWAKFWKDELAALLARTEAR